MVRLLRRNDDDPRLIADLELLARVDAGEDLPPVESEGAPVAADPVLEDPFVRWFVRASVHLRRYFPFYVGGVAWALMMLLVPTVGGGGDAADADAEVDASAGADATAGDTATTVTPTEVVGLPSPTPELTAPPVAFAESVHGDAPSSTTVPGDDERATFDDSAFPSTTSAPEVRRLAIVKSGYSSRTGGTPLEQAPPQGGLPVAAAGGQATKRSFVALTGDQAALRLEVVADSSNVNVEQAVVKACAITAASWDAARGSSFESEPAWGDPCVTGTRGADGSFTFDLSSFGAVDERSGFALVPGDASFNLTFKAQAS